MTRLIWATALAVFGGSPVVCTAQPVAAADASATTICGMAIDREGSLSWNNFSHNRIATGSDLEALQNILFEHSLRWSATLRNGVTGAFDSLQSDPNGIKPADFSLSKTADLPARQVAFGRTTFQLELPVNAEAAPCAASATAAKELNAAGSFVALVERVLVEQRKDRINAGAARLATLEKYYDAYLFDGFPMFPWEAAINSWLIADRNIADGPPRDAIVFLHPSPGVIAGTESKNSDAGGTLAVEPIGWIRYNADYTKWYGVSLLAAFPTDRNRGYGISLNYMQFKLGVIWQDGEDDKGRDGAAIFIGADLLKLREGQGEAKSLWGLLQKDQ